ncbi:MAG: hypothetical protein ACLSCV_10930 [Acutalibacteraceae bacterium]
MTSSMVSAMILSDLILKKKYCLYLHHRMHIGLSAKQAVKDTVHSVRGLQQDLWRRRAMVERLRTWRHCRIENKKLEFIRMKTERHIVQARCTILGANWNGIRMKKLGMPMSWFSFDYMGHVIDNQQWRI